MIFPIPNDCQSLINNYGMSLNRGKSIFESGLYREFLAERDEILRHKWIESEKVGYDIGFDKALMEWIVRHRKDWRLNRKPNY